MRTEIPQGRQFYLECAKLSSDRKYRIECFKNFVRVLNKEISAQQGTDQKKRRY